MLALLFLILKKVESKSFIVSLNLYQQKPWDPESKPLSKLGNNMKCRHQIRRDTSVQRQANSPRSKAIKRRISKETIKYSANKIAMLKNRVVSLMI